MAEWKKIIVSGSDAHLASVTASNLTNDNILVAGTGGAVESSGITYDGVTLALGSSAINSSGTSTVLTGSFSGSFTGDGTGLTGLTADAVAFTNITGKPTLISSSAQVDHDQTTNFVAGEHFLQSAITTVGTVTTGDVSAILPAGTISGSAQLPAGIVSSSAQTIANLPAGTVSSSLQFNTTTTPFTGSFTGSFTGDGSGLTGLATTLTVTDNSTPQTIDLQSETLKFVPASVNEITVDTTTADTVTIGLPDDVTIGNNLTVTGNLNVQGSTVTIDTTNLAVDDKFILINSGSSTATDESGIIFGGSRGAANNGAALIWNGDYNGNDGRLAIADSVNADATTAAVSYYVGGVYLGTSGNAETAKADHPGNIRVEGSDIFIYV